MTRDDIRIIVLRVVQDYLDTLEQTPITLAEDTRLIGRVGILDSLGLVNVIIDLEGAFREMGYTVVMTDEKAMSQHNSPFRSVGTIIDYLAEQIGNAHG